jgi:FlaA1/EpsC-like NDP-sugar epimerase
MTLDESVTLIKNAIVRGQSGETWIPKLRSMNMKDLADIFAERHEKPVRIIGMRPGEKIHEDLINHTEWYRMYMKDDRYFVLRPSYTDQINTDKNPWMYTSGGEDELLEKEKLLEYLQALGVLESPMEEHKGKSIEEIRK